MTPRHITRALLARWPLPALDPALGKAARGSLLVVGGSDANPGAAMLAARAALRVGAGTLTLATSANRAAAVGAAFPEARVVGVPVARGELARLALVDELACSDALVVGPGMADGAATRALLRRCLRDRPALPCVIDAGALDALVAPKQLVPWILTPHPGEMARLCKTSPDRVLDDPLRLAHDMAAKYRSIVVLKGNVTYVVAPDGTAYQNTAGNLGLGTAGSGDVLAGIIGGLCARGATPLQAAAWGVHLHACAGDVLARKIGPLGFLASELLPELPRLVARVGRPARRRA